MSVSKDAAMNQDVYVGIEHLRGQLTDITLVMLAAARQLARGTGGSVVGVLLGHKLEELAGSLPADRVISIDHPALAEFNPDAYSRVLASLLKEQAPRAVLFGETSMGAELGALLSARLGWPLVSHCQTLRVDEGTPRFISQICGGKIMAQGDLPGPTALLTMIPGGFKPESGGPQPSPQIVSMPAPLLEDLRVRLKQYLEPEVGDVDISRVPILVAVGRGIQNKDNLELAEGLAEVLGGVVCGSRPIVDQGWLPTSRLVGKSGRKVKPKLYLALGISGAPEHLEGLADAEMIVAINTDPGAPIFDVAKYGAAADLFDLVPVLTEKMRQAKSG